MQSFALVQYLETQLILVYENVRKLTALSIAQHHLSKFQKRRFSSMTAEELIGFLVVGGTVVEFLHVAIGFAFLATAWYFFQFLSFETQAEKNEKEEKAKQAEKDFKKWNKKRKKTKKKKTN